MSAVGTQAPISPTAGGRLTDVVLTCVGVVLGATLEPKLLYHSPALWQLSLLFLLLILNDRAASSYQLLDLSLADSRLDTLFFAVPLSFEDGVLVLSVLANCLMVSSLISSPDESFFRNVFVLVVSA